MSYQLLVYAHILVLVFWLGTDVAVLYLSRQVVSRDHSPAIRVVLARSMMVLDTFPNVAVALMLPLGITLAALGGHAPIPDWGVAVAWAIGVPWAVAILLLLRGGDARRALLIGRIDLAWRVMAVVGLIVAAVASLSATSTVSAWLAVKLLVYAVLLLTGIGITSVFAPVIPALEELATTGSTPRTEEQITRGLNRATPLVLVLYACLLVSAFLGVVKPG